MFPKKANNMLDANDKRDIERMIDLDSRRAYSKRVGDTPNDALQLIPKKYVEFTATTANRPASVTGTMTRFFFNATDNRPWWYSPVTSVWVDSTGSLVASN